MRGGWFRSERPTVSDPSCHVVTVQRHSDGRIAGAGFILGGNVVLTCAHVVNGALGRGKFDYRAPGPEKLRVQVAFSGALSRAYPARVEHWIPPRARDGGVVREGDDEWFGDLSVLRVDMPAQDLPAPPDRATMDLGQEVGAWHGGGRRSSLARLAVVSLHDSVAYLDGDATGVSVGRGYSGGPLWCSREQAVVGLVVAHVMPPEDPLTGAPVPYSPQHTIRRSWGVPWQRVEAELLPLGILQQLTETAPDPDDPGFLLMSEAIENALPLREVRRSYGIRLAGACGVGYKDDVTEFPSPDEMAAFLLTHPRAVAAFSHILRNDRLDAADRVLEAGSLSRTPRLLSPLEYAELRKILRTLDRAILSRFREAVRAALPHLAALPGLDTLDALLDHLETLHGDGHRREGGRRIPAMLRAVEFSATLCPTSQQAQLRLWVDGVARRLGIGRASMLERRADAEEWARSRSAPCPRARVLVRVARAERGRYRLRIWCDDGAGPRQVSTDSLVSYTRLEAAREMLRVLDTLTTPDEDERLPLVEVLVDRANLNLAIDEWEARAPDEIVPGALGVEFPIVVHCPELLRRHGRFLRHWRSRWSRIDSGKALVVSEASEEDSLYAMLVNRLDTVRVSVDLPPGPRERTVQTCLALGIPVVVWDRGRNGASHVVKHTAGVATRELPDGVRDYRANAKVSPPEFPGRPVLAWADADRDLPQLQLMEPQEGA